MQTRMGCGCFASGGKGEKKKTRTGGGGGVVDGKGHSRAIMRVESDCSAVRLRDQRPCVLVWSLAKGACPTHSGGITVRGYLAAIPSFRQSLGSGRSPGGQGHCTHGPRCFLYRPLQPPTNATATTGPL